MQDDGHQLPVGVGAQAVQDAAGDVVVHAQPRSAAAARHADAGSRGARPSAARTMLRDSVSASAGATTLARAKGIDSPPGHVSAAHAAGACHALRRHDPRSEAVSIGA